MLFNLLALAVLSAFSQSSDRFSLPFASASSVARNPLKVVETIQDPFIDAPRHRVSAYSHFDLSFFAFRRRILFKLEPNHDILAPDAHVQYLDANGEIERSEPIDRLQHKVFKGDVYAQNLDRSFDVVGHARVMLHRDGDDPLFEGSFTINHDHHHIQLGENYRQTRHEQDPDSPKKKDGEHMVLFRDSDITETDEVHLELKKRAADEHVFNTCNSDELEFNMDLEHPIFSGGMDQQDPFWSTPVSSMFGKRQLDTSSGPGNSAGVNLVSSIGQTAGCPNTRKVALVGVATDCSYGATFNGTDAVRANVINQMNSASALYEKTFNISLGLQNLTISPQDCPGSPPVQTPWNVPCSGNVDIQARLNLFSTWRGNQNDNNALWTLLTNCNSGSAVGLAWLGQACVVSAQARNATSGGVQTISGANVVARTSTEWQVIAHETGHTFGAVHDCTSQTCSDGTAQAQQCCPLSSTTCDAGQRYIMNPSTGQGITAFSACSIGNICSALGRNSVKSTCLYSNKGIPLVTQAVCGNGIVEQGEECDSTGPCCNHATCKFASGAACDPMSEECCTTSCQISPKDIVCRQSTGECDPGEMCNGSSPTCPPDVTKPDGVKCGNQTGLACASGQCTSRNQQCKTLMGAYTSSNSTSSSSSSSAPQACDDSNCVLSCSSPNFGNGGQCWGLNQNFLDGTPCGGGGKCQNGQCKGSSFGKEITGWIGTHKPLVIGVSVGVGSIVLFMIIYGIIKRYRLRRSGVRIPPKFTGSNSSFRQRTGRNGGYQQTWSGGPTAPGYVPPPYVPPEYVQPQSGWKPAYGGGSSNLGRYA